MPDRALIEVPHPDLTPRERQVRRELNRRDHCIPNGHLFTDSDACELCGERRVTALDYGGFTVGVDPGIPASDLFVMGPDVMSLDWKTVEDMGVPASEFADGLSRQMAAYARLGFATKDASLGVITNLLS